LKKKFVTVDDISMLTQKKSRTDPRLAFPVELTPEVALARLKPKMMSLSSTMEIRQRFDASSTALQVLRGSDLSDQCVIVTGATSGIGS